MCRLRTRLIIFCSFASFLCSCVASQRSACGAEPAAKFAVVEVPDVVPAELNKYTPEWREVPTWLSGAKFLAPPGGGTKRKTNKIEFTVKETGLVLIAASWSYDGNSGGDWQPTRKLLKDLIADGWQPLGEMILGEKDKHTLLRRSYQSGEQASFHTRKYNAPWVILPAAEQLATIAALPVKSAEPAKVVKTPAPPATPSSTPPATASTKPQPAPAKPQSVPTAPPAEPLPTQLEVKTALPQVTMPIAQLCRDPLPECLVGSRIYARVPKKGEADVRQGRLELEVKEKTPVLMAVSWQKDGNASGGWTEEVVEHAAFPRAGWVLVGGLEFQDPAIPGHLLYWRLCEPGDKFTVRTRKYRPPYVILPAPQKAEKLPDLLKSTTDDVLAGEAFKARVNWLLNNRRFDELTALEKNLRETKARFDSGDSQLKAFYSAFGVHATQEARDEQFKLLEAWLAAHPETAAPRLAIARWWITAAWLARGSGYAHAVTEEQFRVFRLRLDAARQHLVEARQLGEKNPHLHALEIEMATDTSEPRDKADQYLREALAIDPLYDEPIGSMVRYLLPRWHGRAGDLEQLAKDVVEFTRQSAGEALYHRVLWEAKTYEGSYLFEDHKFDYVREKKACEDLLALYPNSQELVEEACLIACYQGDRATAQKLLSRFKSAQSQYFPDAERWRFPFESSWRSWADPNYHTGDQRAVLDGCHSPIYDLAWSADGNEITSYEADWQARVWNVGKQQQTERFQIYSSGAAVMLPGAQAIVAMNREHEVKLYQLETSEEKLLGSHQKLAALALSPDSRMLVTVGEDRSSKIWDLQSATQVAELPPQGEVGVYAAGLSPDHKTLVTGDWQGRVRFFDIATQKPSGELPTLAAGVRRLAISPDGSRLAIADHKQITLWSLPDRMQLGQLELPANIAWVNQLEFSPQGNLLAGSAVRKKPDPAGDVIVWNVATRQLQKVLTGHKLSVVCSHFSPDGKSIASGSEDMTVRVWDIGK